MNSHEKLKLIMTQPEVVGDIDWIEWITIVMQVMNEDTKRIEELEAECEAAVKMVLDAGLATGHADTFTDLMGEVLGQYAELKAEVKQVNDNCDYWADKHTALVDGLRLYANYIDGSVGSPMWRIRQDLLALIGKEKQE
jgi:hypothetical protein